MDVHYQVTHLLPQLDNGRINPVPLFITSISVFDHKCACVEFKALIVECHKAEYGGEGARL